MFGNLKVAQLPIHKSAMIGENQDSTPVVTIINRFKNLIDPHMDAQLFQHLASQRLFRAFPRIHFPARKLPIARVLLIFRTFGNQDFSVVNDNSSSNQQGQIRTVMFLFDDHRSNIANQIEQSYYRNSLGCQKLHLIFLPRDVEHDSLL